MIYVSTDTDPESSVSVGTVFSSNAKLGLTRRNCPVDVDGRLQSAVDSVENWPSKLRAVLTEHNRIASQRRRFYISLDKINKQVNIIYKQT